MALGMFCGHRGVSVAIGRPASQNRTEPHRRVIVLLMCGFPRAGRPCIRASIKTQPSGPVRIYIKRPSHGTENTTPLSSFHFFFALFFLPFLSPPFHRTPHTSLSSSFLRPPLMLLLPLIMRSYPPGFPPPNLSLKSVYLGHHDNCVGTGW